MGTECSGDSLAFQRACGREIRAAFDGGNITSDGTIYQTNLLETVCYFAGSNTQHNPLGVCVCFAGNFTSEVPTEAQLSSGGKLLAFLMRELRLPMESIRGHKEFVVTQSPGQQWDSGQNWRTKSHI